MQLERVEKVKLFSGQTYTGWGYYQSGSFIPHGCGKKYYDGYYVYGNFRNGIVDGPAIDSHDYYMFTQQFKNNRGNGWGMRMANGDLAEFGYYENSQMKNDLTDFVYWYFKKMTLSGRNGNMLNMYTYNESHEVAELLIGYKGDGFNCFMGFGFMADGSVWVGTTETRRKTGKLVHFRADGQIDAGEFENGTLVERQKLQDIIDDYYETWTFDDDLFGSLLSQNKSMRQMENEQTRDEFRNIKEIEAGHNYFTLAQDKPEETYSSENTYKMTYHVQEMDSEGTGSFDSINEEEWDFGDNFIVTPHGTLEIDGLIFVDQGPMVGIEFSVCGSLNLEGLSNSFKFYGETEIDTLALVRQPHNVWLWVYMFDEDGRPIATFCGHDDLDGLAHYVSKMRRIYRFTNDVFPAKD